jgi:hypothetical protein
VEGNNFNYEKTDHSYAASRGSHASELVHDRRRKAGADHDHDVANDSEKEHRAEHDCGANDDPLLAAVDI